MTQARYIQPGKTVPFKNGATAVSYGDVVSLATRIAIAAENIAANATGNAHVEGVWELPKAAGAVTVGAAVYWDATATNITTTAEANIPAGYAVLAAAAGDTVIKVKLLG
jgi:predicted RecA/RadA family phage recombinase